MIEKLNNKLELQIKINNEVAKLKNYPKKNLKNLPL